MNELARFNTVNQISLFHELTGDIKRLDGFKKSHRVPDTFSDRNNQFVGEIAEELLNEDLDNTHASLRSVFGFKRKEISVSGPEAGFGAINTPLFNYEIAIEQQESAPQSYRLTRRVSEIREPQRALGSEFETVFPDRFRTLEVTAESEFDLESIIDRVEDAESESVSIDYDKNVTWCKIDIGPALVRITENRIRIIDQNSGKNLRGLFDAFQAVHKQFIAMLELNDQWFSKS